MHFQGSLFLGSPSWWGFKSTMTTSWRSTCPRYGAILWVKAFILFVGSWLRQSRGAVTDEEEPLCNDLSWECGEQCQTKVTVMAGRHSVLLRRLLVTIVCFSLGETTFISLWRSSPCVTSNVYTLNGKKESKFVGQWCQEEAMLVFIFIQSVNSCELQFVSTTCTDVFGVLVSEWNPTDCFCFRKEMKSMLKQLLFFLFFSGKKWNLCWNNYFFFLFVSGKKWNLCQLLHYQMVPAVFSGQGKL